MSRLELAELSVLNIPDHEIPAEHRSKAGSLAWWKGVLSGVQQTPQGVEVYSTEGAFSYHQFAYSLIDAPSRMTPISAHSKRAYFDSAGDMQLGGFYVYGGKKTEISIFSRDHDGAPVEIPDFERDLVAAIGRHMLRGRGDDMLRADGMVVVNLESGSGSQQTRTTLYTVPEFADAVAIG